MLSKNKIKFIRSFEQKKFRQESGCFLAEGNKLVTDILPFFTCELLIAQPVWLDKQNNVLARELIVADENDIRKASLLKNPQDVIAVFRQSQNELDKESLKNELSLMLDGIQDPGNLGTIIRIADWFGIKNVICSPDTVDLYSPKVVQATMGAFAHVHVHYLPLPELLKEMDSIPLYGTFLEGENIYVENLSSAGIIIMGNEGNGIRPELEQLISRKLVIPNYPPDAASTDSLNVAVATAVTCAEFRRRAIGR